MYIPEGEFEHAHGHSFEDLYSQKLEAACKEAILFPSNCRSHLLNMKVDHTPAQYESGTA